MLEARNTVPRFTISLKRSTQNLQLSTTTPADYPIYWSIRESGERRLGHHTFEVRTNDWDPMRAIAFLPAAKTAAHLAGTSTTCASRPMLQSSKNVIVAEWRRLFDTLTQSGLRRERHRVKLSIVESVTPLIVTAPITSTLISGTSGRTNRSTKTRVPLGTIVHPYDAGLGSGEGVDRASVGAHSSLLK